MRPLSLRWLHGSSCWGLVPVWKGFIPLQRDDAPVKWVEAPRALSPFTWEASASSGENSFSFHGHFCFSFLFQTQSWAFCRSVMHMGSPCPLGSDMWASALFSSKDQLFLGKPFSHPCKETPGDSTWPNFQACPCLSDGHIKWTSVLWYVRETQPCSSIWQEVLLMNAVDLSTSAVHYLCKEHHAFPMFCHINSDNNWYRKVNTELPSPNLNFRLRSVPCGLLWESGLALLSPFILHRMKEVVWMDF